MQAPGAPSESTNSLVPDHDGQATSGSFAPRKRRGARKEGGLAAVEFAIGAMLLLLLGFGAWEYGLFLNKGQTLANGVRTAARVTATACIPPSDLDNRVAVDPDCQGGNKASDDFTTLRTLQASLGKDWNAVDKILIYKVPGTATNRGDGKPPVGCMGSDGEVQSQLDWCTRFDSTTTFMYEGSPIPLLKNLDKFFYTSSEATAQNNADLAAALAAGKPAPTTFVQADDPKSKLIDDTFDCATNTTSPSYMFCPTRKVVEDAVPTPIRKRGLNSASNVGVYVKLNHSMITGLFGKEQKIAQWSLFRLEPSPYDNTPYSCTGKACDAPPATPAGTADLQVTKTDGLTEAIPNDPVVYTITVKNAGPDAATGVLIKDPTFPPQLVNNGWTCAPVVLCESGDGSASGSILDESINLAPGAIVTYTWNATVKADLSATPGNIYNTATVTAPITVTDPTPANNTATDRTDVVKPDLQISKLDDELSTASPFQPIVYKLDINNVGQVNVAGATVNWTLPPQLTVTSWQCVSATLGASCATTNQTGPFGDTITIPKTGSLSYEIRGTVKVDASGSMNPSATVTLPGGLIDDNLADNTRADTVATLIVAPDLKIEKDDGKTFIGPLEDTTYTIKASNTGAFRVEGVRITDTPPASLTNVTWTCVASPGNICPSATGSGAVDYTTNLAGGSNITFTMTGTVAASATGSVANSATITGPSGLVETDLTNNTDADDPDVIRLPELEVTKNDNRVTPAAIAPGMSNTYTITVRNAATVSAKNVSIVDNPPATLSGVTWACTGGTNGATCGAVTSGTGNLSIVRDIPSLGQLTFTLTGTLSTTASGTLSNTVSASYDPGIGLPAVTATDTTPIRYPDLKADKTVTPIGIASPGQTVAYSVTYTNLGPGTAANANLVDPIPTGVSAFTSWTCAATGGATCPAATGAGAIAVVQTMPEGGALTFVIQAKIANSATGTVTNTATAAANLATPDTLSGNNISSASNTIVSPDLFATLTSNPASASTVGPKSVVVYTFAVGNTSAASGTAPAGVVANLNMPSQMQTFTWVCAATGGAVCPTLSGSGAISETTTAPLPPGGKLTYTVTGTLKDVPAVGTMTTTGTVVPPSGMIQQSGSTPDTATVTHIVGHPDVKILKTATASNVGPGQTFSYTLTATNMGPGIATGFRVVDTFDATKLGSISWTCTGTACGAATGTGNISDLTGNIAVNGTAVYSVSVKVLDAARTSVSNTATMTSTTGLVDPDTTNNTSTVAVTIQLPDLVVTKTDGITQISPNQTNSYTITFKNKGPGPVTGVTIADAVDTTKLTVTSWTCSATGGATCPTTPTTSLNAVVDLPANGQLNFTLNVTVKGTATGSLVNTATITATAAVPDRDLVSVGSENSVTDTDTIVIPDLSVTKTDSQTNVAAGQQLTYLITAKNNGPGPVTNAILTDTPPVALTSVTWSCGSASGGGVCPTPSSGSIASGATFTSVIPNLPAGSQVIYSIVGTVGPLASGSIIQNVQLDHPGGVTDPTPGNNGATDTNTIKVSDLSISKNDGVTTVAGGQVVTYTVTASNAGPGPVIGAKITDTPPASLLTGASPWACNGTTGGASCPAPGTGRNLNVTATIPAGGSITYKFTATVDPALTTGSFTNTADIAQPTGYTDPTPGNNTAPDTDTIVMSDLAVDKDDGLINVGPNQQIAYSIVLSNAGPGPVTNAKFSDPLPTSLTGVTYQCTSTVGATCPTSGSIAIATGGTIAINNVNLLAGESVTYTVSATVSATATGTITNTVTFNHASGPEPSGTSANNTDFDTDNVLLPDPYVTKSRSSSTRGRGDSQTYTVTVGNNGPGPVSSVTLTDVIPSQILTPTVTCAVTGTAVCPAVTSPLATGATFNPTVTNLAGGSTVKFTIKGNVAPTASSGSVVNTASITASLDRDTSATSNSASASFTISSPDLQITKNRTPTSFVPGQAFAYTLLVTNAGPGSVTGAVIKDSAMTNFTGTTWTCAVTTGSPVCPPASPNTAAALASGITTGLMPSGSALTITFNGSIPASATGNVSNTATVDPPTGQNIIESITTNNTDTKTDPITQPDISVVKDNSQTQLIPGQAVTYTVKVKNNGATTASSIGVTDTPPTVLVTGSSPWSCAGASCVAAGTGRNLNVTLPTLAAGDSVTYTMTATVSTTAPAANVTNKADITSATDPNAANNTSSDTDPVVHPDLGITKSDSVTTVWPRYAGTYTIVAKNYGPGIITAATVTDTMPTGVTGVSWTCTGAGGGTCPTGTTTGNISAALVNLPVNATATFTVNYTVSDNFYGSIANTASIAAPSGFTDPDLSNNSQTDTNTSVKPNLAISKDDSLAEVWPGRRYTYSIVVTNPGTVPVTGALVNDALPSQLTNGTWTCSGTGGGTCTAGPVNGNITNQSVNVPVGGTVTFLMSATVTNTATVSVANTATVAVPSYTDDSAPLNNTSTDTNIITLPDVVVTKGNGVTAVTAGSATTYTITVKNKGPGNVTGAVIADVMPTAFNVGSVNWSCVVVSGTGSCAASSGTGNISTTVNLDANAQINFIVTGTISSTATGRLINNVTAALTNPSDRDTTSAGSENSATDNDPINPVPTTTTTTIAPTTTRNLGGT
jgi:uncharacterized repeat protein (TIGR01451 family)